MRVRRSFVPYLVILPVVGAALFLGSRNEGGPPTLGQRADRIAREVRCPTCESQSAADSRAPASDAIRAEIRRRLEAGESDDEVRAFLVSRYGKDILLKPEAEGVAGLVWALPVATGMCAVAGLALAFRRWRRREPGQVSLEDRVLVEQAREG